MRKLSTLLLTLVLTTSFLMDEQIVEAWLANAYGTHAILIKVNRAAMAPLWCPTIEQFQQQPVLQTLMGPLPNARVGQPIPMSIDPAKCVEGENAGAVVMFLLKNPRLLVPWPSPFIVSPQQ